MIGCNSTNPALQADLVMTGIGRLIEVKDALAQYRRVIGDLVARKVISTDDVGLAKAEERASQVLASIDEKRVPS